MTSELTPELVAQFSDDDGATYMPSRLQEVILEYLHSETSDAIALPFPQFTEAMDGGLRPGEVCLVAGYTYHGKSIFVDQIADTAAGQGARVHTYLSEMSAAQRGLRLLSRKAGIPLKTLKRKDLSPEQWRGAIAELKLLNYGYTLISGWSVEEVMSHILKHRWDLAVIDLIHGFDYSDERDLSRISNALVATAKESTIHHHGTAIVAAAHLNDGQMRDVRSPKPPKPGLHSLKGSSSLKQNADSVILVWQDSNETGQPSGAGRIWIAKNRQGDLADVPVWLNKKRLRFEVDEGWES